MAVSSFMKVSCCSLKYSCVAYLREDSVGEDGRQQTGEWYRPQY